MEFTVHSNVLCNEKTFLESLADFKFFLAGLNAKSVSNMTRIQQTGNVSYLHGGFDLAILLYNKALTLAESDEQKALLYGNRSAACLEMEKYEECLQNIQWARDHKFPEEKLQKLNEREKKCLELMANEEKIDVLDFLNLSHEPNPKVPFLIDGLEVRIDKNEKGIFATKDLKVGDIISMEKSIKNAPVVHQTGFESVLCGVCLRNNNLTLVPCKTCTFSMFCCEKCQKYHELNECNNTDFTFDGIPTWMMHPFSIFNKVLAMVGGSVDELEKLWTECQENPKTVFELDLSDPDDPECQKNQLRAFFSVKDEKNYPAFKYQSIFLVHPNYKPKRRFIKNLLKWIIGIVNTETIFIQSHPMVSFISLFNPTIKDSCVPNIRPFLHDSKLGFYVSRPISAGDEIFKPTITKFYKFPIETRQSLHMRTYGKPCTCIACLNPTKYTLLEDLKHVPNERLDAAVKKYENFTSDYTSKAELMKAIREMSEILQSSAADYPHRNYVKGEKILSELFLSLKKPIVLA